MSLSGKIIIVTGAASGMGKATVEKLLSEKAVVYAVDWNEAVLKKAFEKTEVHPITCDISKSQMCDELIDMVVNNEGRVDGIVNFAGVLKRTGILNCTDEEFDYVMDINTKGCFYLTRAVARKMKKQGSGSIVNVSSIWSDVGAKGVLAYCASKGAVSQITRCAALDLAGTGVRVNEIRPGETNTPMLASERGKDFTQVDIDNKLKEIAATIPEKRLAEPAEIANAAIFLLSDDSSYMQGSHITVDGGYTAL
jgi:NAD(P)-dependent dehydrogenase (short-subunit alcohol dehydrogenase family)